jgi:hypothetical protein
MADGGYYSIRDLTNISGQPRSVVTDVMQFLTTYGFVKEIGTSEPLFTKSSIILSPTQSMNILQCVTKD